VFDRVRENTPLLRKNSFSQIVNVSVWETLTRSINTTLITVVPIVTLLLFGGSTLPEARGRGAYRSLVAARWHDAVARGTPVLVTQASPMSRPILAQLGFREVCEIRILLDAFG